MYGVSNTTKNKNIFDVFFKKNCITFLLYPTSTRQQRHKTTPQPPNKSQTKKYNIGEGYPSLDSS